MEFDDKKFYLNHFPRKHKNDCINLFGHTHRTTGLWKPYGLNVGCDINHFYLFSQNDIHLLLKRKAEWWDIDPDALDIVKYRKDIPDFRDEFLANNIIYENFIGFYTRKFFCLDNFSAFKFVYENIEFPTVEHAYQAYKFKETAPDIFDKIAKCNSPVEAKKIAVENADKICLNWEKIKVDLMKKLLLAKMNQNPYVKEKLLSTKDYIICEDSNVDDFWGIGRNRDGQNMLGKLWMEIREEIIKN